MATHALSASASYCARGGNGVRCQGALRCGRCGRHSGTVTGRHPAHSWQAGHLSPGPDSPRFPPAPTWRMAYERARSSGGQPPRVTARAQHTALSR